MHSVSGEDISVCVCLAILTSLFDDEGSYPYGTRYLHLLPVLSLRLLLCVMSELESHLFIRNLR